MPTSSSDSTIPDEIQQLGLPAIQDVVLIGGGVMEIYGVRDANDIDLVVSLGNWQYLRNLPNWNLKEKKDFRRYLSDDTGRFDVWRWWFNPEDHSRTKLSKLKVMSVQHPAGFYYLTPEAQLMLKQQLHRDKDDNDITMLKKMVSQQ